MRRITVLALLLCVACTPQQSSTTDVQVACAEPRAYVPGGRSVAGDDVATGVLVQCAGRPVPGVPVRLQGRIAGSQDLRLLEQGTTDEDGRVQWTLSPVHSTVLVGEADVDGDVVRSESAVVTVQTRVEVDVERTQPCGLKVEGRTVPAKPGNLIGVLAQDGSFRYATLIANEQGVFRGSFPFPCDRPVRLNVMSGPSVTNEQGASYTPGNVVPDRARTCGSHDTDPQPTRDGLRQEVLMPAATVLPGHGWHGWASVTNVSDKPVTVDPDELSYALTLPGGDVVAESSTTRWGVYDPRDEPQELQPGEVLLRPLVVASLNCFPRGGQSGSEPIYQLPAGEYDLTVTRPEEWHSEPVRLAVKG